MEGRKGRWLWREKREKEKKNKKQKKWVVVSKDKNIGNHGYIGSSILRIYRIYQRYINEYFDTILIDLKLIKTYENVKQSSYKWN